MKVICTDCDKVIILPIIIQKYIFEFIYNIKNKNNVKWYNNNKFNYEAEEYYNYQKYLEPDDEIKYRFWNYPLVNWNWFKICQSINVNYYLPNYNKDMNINLFKSDNKYIFMNKSIVKQLLISIFKLNKELINEINKFKSLESITIINDTSEWCGNSFHSLVHLNNLNDQIVVNFDLNIFFFENLYEMDVLELQLIDIPLTFKVNQFKSVNSYEYESSSSFIYTHIISKLNFKSIELKSIVSSDVNGSSHLKLYHSISKLNQTNLESVIIQDDCIPLYAFYRFLKAPSLKTLEFNFQFHFISKLYEEENNNSNNNLNFEELDKFEFKNFTQYQNEEEEEEYYDHGINEDNQLYCNIFTTKNNTNFSIPPYSRQLWNECIKLLSKNKTITNLEIRAHDCFGCEIEFDSEHGLYWTPSKQFLYDFFDAIAINKSIKTLYLQFDHLCIDTQYLLIPIITSLLDQNTTLELCYINIETKNEIKNLTKNTKCKLF